MADRLAERLKQRTAQLAQERQISAAPPIVVGGALWWGAHCGGGRIDHPSGHDISCPYMPILTRYHPSDRVPCVSPVKGCPRPRKIHPARTIIGVNCWR